MAEAARFDQLRELFELHLAETEAQVERINECFDLIGQTAKAKPCRGMMGLVDEGEEIIAEGEDREDAAADLALIAAAQRVEHYEIAGYTTARNLAQQLRHSDVVSLLSKSLAEEENADQLLNQVARSLMSVAKMPAAIAASRITSGSGARRQTLTMAPARDETKCWPFGIYDSPKAIF
jgi:Mn-containing catalase